MATTVEVDPELSLAALLELLGNALRHAAKGSEIRVHTAHGAGAVTFSIHQALGLPPTDSPDQWGRTPLSSTRRDGYGLGMFRARRIIESQLGTLQCTYSEADQQLVTKVVMPTTAAG